MRIFKTVYKSLTEEHKIKIKGGIHLDGKLKHEFIKNNLKVKFVYLTR